MTNRSFYIALFYFSLLLISCDTSVKRAKKKKKEPLVSQQVLNGIQEGDILLRYAQGPFSTKIVEFMGEKNPISHCGVVVNLNGKITVVHSVSEELSGQDGVQTQELPVFASDISDSMFVVIRPRICDSAKSEIASNAKYYLQKKASFDHDYNTADSSRLYCGELLYYTVGSVMGKNVIDTKVFDDTVSLVMFNSFFNEKYFELIYSLKPVKK